MKVLRNILAVILGVFIGGTVNMALINVSGSIIPPPEGSDLTTMEGLTAAMHLFEPKHFIMPFVAHAFGTLVGAVITGLIAVTHKMKFALVIGFVFLIGGIMMSIQLPAPMWYNSVDLILAYIPMAWIGGKISNPRK